MIMPDLVLFLALLFTDFSEQGRWRPRPPQMDKVVSLAFSPDSRALASMTDHQSYRLWEVSSGKELKKVKLSIGKEEVPKSVTYLPDGNLVILLYKYEGFDFDEATGWAKQGTISSCLWNMATGKKSPFIEIGYGGLGICPKGQFLALDNGLWEIATGKKMRNFDIIDPRVLTFKIEFSPDGKTLAYWICESLAQNASMILLVNVATGKKVLQIGDLGLEVPEFCFRSPPTFSPDGKAIAFSQEPEGRIHVRKVAADKDIAWNRPTIHEEVLAFSPDGKTLITCHATKGMVRFWEVATSKVRRSIKIEGDVQSPRLSPDGKIIAFWKGNRVEFRRIDE
jgi:WD40 repeat protein